MKTFLIIIVFASIPSLGSIDNSKDPFVPLATKRSGFRDRTLLQQYDLSQLKVIGVMFDIKEPRVLLKDPSGLTHIATLKNKIGKLDGTIVKINKNSIFIQENVARLDGGEEKRFITMTLNR